MPQCDLVFAGVLLLQHLGQIVGEQVVHTVDVSLLDGDPHQCSGEGFGAGVQREHAVGTVPVLIVLIDDDAVFHGEHPVDGGGFQRLMQQLELFRVHPMVFRGIGLPEKGRFALFRNGRRRRVCRRGRTAGCPGTGGQQKRDKEGENQSFHCLIRSFSIYLASTERPLFHTWRSPAFVGVFWAITPTKR